MKKNTSNYLYGLFFLILLILAPERAHAAIVNIEICGVAEFIVSEPVWTSAGSRFCAAVSSADTLSGAGAAFQDPSTGYYYWEDMAVVFPQIGNSQAGIEFEIVYNWDYVITISNQLPNEFLHVEARVATPALATYLAAGSGSGSQSFPGITDGSDPAIDYVFELQAMIISGVTPVPLPGTMLFLLSGLGLLVGFAKTRQPPRAVAE